MNPKPTDQSVTIDLRAYTEPELCVGPKAGGPTRCLKCNRTFKVGEIWQRLKSPPDPEFGSYFIGVHLKCPVARMS